MLIEIKLKQDSKSSRRMTTRATLRLGDTDELVGTFSFSADKVTRRVSIIFIPTNDRKLVNGVKQILILAKGELDGIQS